MPSFMTSRRLRTLAPLAATGMLLLAPPAFAGTVQHGAGRSRSEAWPGSVMTLMIAPMSGIGFGSPAVTGRPRSLRGTPTQPRLTAAAPGRVPLWSSASTASRRGP
jgi:hypothetical protein